jgi:hypothetical protein
MRLTIKAETTRETIRILMESRFYFDLRPKERLDLLKHVIATMKPESVLTGSCD